MRSPTKENGSVVKNGDPAIGLSTPVVGLILNTESSEPPTYRIFPVGSTTSPPTCLNGEPCGTKGEPATGVKLPEPRSMVKADTASGGDPWAMQQPVVANKNL